MLVRWSSIRQWGQVLYSLISMMDVRPILYEGSRELHSYIVDVIVVASFPHLITMKSWDRAIEPVCILWFE